MPSSLRGDVLKRDVEGQSYLRRVVISQTIAPRYRQLCLAILRDLRFLDSPPEERPLIESIAIARCLEAEELGREPRSLKDVLECQRAIREHTRALTALRKGVTVAPTQDDIDRVNQLNDGPSSPSQ
jgi:hypothetical protein